MRGEKEHYINPKTRVWIGDPINPVEPGTYCRYYSSKEEGNSLNITFKRVDLGEEIYNKRLTTMSIELVPRAPRKTDTRVNLDIQSRMDWETYSITKKNRSYDIPFPQIFGGENINPQPSFVDSSEQVTITAQDLKAVKSAGFFIENCGNKHIFPTEEIIAVISDHANRSITIKRKGLYGEPISTTYSLKKIGNCGALPKTNQKVI